MKVCTSPDTQGSWLSCSGKSSAKWPSQTAPTGFPSSLSCALTTCPCSLFAGISDSWARYPQHRFLKKVLANRKKMHMMKRCVQKLKGFDDVVRGENLQQVDRAALRINQHQLCPVQICCTMPTPPRVLHSHWSAQHRQEPYISWVGCKLCWLCIEESISKDWMLLGEPMQTRDWKDSQNKTYSSLQMTQWRLERKAK